MFTNAMKMVNWLLLMWCGTDQCLRFCLWVQVGPHPHSVPCTCSTDDKFQLNTVAFQLLYSLTPILWTGLSLHDKIFWDFSLDTLHFRCQLMCVLHSFHGTCSLIFCNYLVQIFCQQHITHMQRKSRQEYFTCHCVSEPARVVVTI
jgi:hypothetical protein